MGSRRRRVTWTEAARGELDDDRRLYCSGIPGSGGTVVERLLTSAASLQEFAERGRSVPEIEDPEIREILVLSFRLMYRVSEAQVTVLGVLHQRRDSGEWRLADLTDSSDAH